MPESAHLVQELSVVRHQQQSLGVRLHETHTTAKDGGSNLFHGYRSLPDHRPSHPYYARTEHVGFLPTGQTSRVPSAKRRDVFGELHPTKNHLSSGFPHLARTFLQKGCMNTDVRYQDETGGHQK